MRIVQCSALITVLVALCGQQAFATDEGTAMGSSSMMMAKCPSSDPAVIVNTSKMTYMMDTKANRDAMKGMLSHDKFVCKSKAEKMGAKMTAMPAMKKM